MFHSVATLQEFNEKGTEPLTEADYNIRLKVAASETFSGYKRQWLPFLHSIHAESEKPIVTERELGVSDRGSDCIADYKEAYIFLLNKHT